MNMNLGDEYNGQTGKILANKKEDWTWTWTLTTSAFIFFVAGHGCTKKNIKSNHTSC